MSSIQVTVSHKGAVQLAAASDENEDGERRGHEAMATARAVTGNRI